MVVASLGDLDRFGGRHCLHPPRPWSLHSGRCGRLPPDHPHLLDLPFHVQCGGRWKWNENLFRMRSERELWSLLCFCATFCCLPRARLGNAHWLLWDVFRVKGQSTLRLLPGVAAHDSLFVLLHPGAAVPSRARAQNYPTQQNKQRIVRGYSWLLLGVDWPYQGIYWYVNLAVCCRRRSKPTYFMKTRFTHAKRICAKSQRYSGNDAHNCALAKCWWNRRFVGNSHTEECGVFYV